MKLKNITVYNGYLPELLSFYKKQGFKNGHLITIEYTTWWYNIWLLFKFLPKPFFDKKYYRASGFWFSHPNFRPIKQKLSNQLESKFKNEN